MITDQLLGNFKIKYGGYYDALPELGTLADLLPFEQKAKIGEKYQVSFLTGLELGQTAKRAKGLYTLNKPVGTELARAELDGSTITMRAQYTWDEVYASLNGSDASYNDVMSLKMKAMGKGASMFRELALAYGPGGTSTVQSNIGVVKTTAGGTLAAGNQQVFLTAASYIRGLWPSMRNAYVDIYQSNGTLRASNVQVIGVPNQRKTLVTFGVSTNTDYVTSGSPAGNFTITAGDLIVPTGWVANSCLGLEGIMNTQAGTLFNVDTTNITQWRTPQYSAGGPLTLQLLREIMALVHDNGSNGGGTLMCSSSAQAALANEYSAKNRDTSQGGAKLQGETSIEFDMPTGRVKVQAWEIAKQGQALYFANSANCYRVGSTDVTMRPIKGLNEGFLTPLIDQPGLQSSMYSNQAPFCELNWHNAIINGIVSNGDSQES